MLYVRRERSSCACAPRKKGTREEAKEVERKVSAKAEKVALEDTTLGRAKGNRKVVSKANVGLVGKRATDQTNVGAASK